MKIAILVNNYNYQNFILECLESITNQTRLPDQIVIVDDGSTDESISIISGFIENNKNLKLELIQKKNSGQLSAFNFGFNALDNDIDLVCFIDSDDKYDSGYLKTLEKVASEFPKCEAFYSSYKFLYTDGSTSPVIFQSKELPPQLLQTIYANRFNGVPTSMVSFKRNALAKILPHSDESSWRIRADDVLIYLSAAMLMNRRYISEPSVLYRIHGFNQFHGKKPDPLAESNRIFALAKLLQPARNKFDNLTLAEKRKILHYEFSSEKPSIKSCIRFLGILLNMPVKFLEIPGYLYAFAKSSIIGTTK